MQIKIKLPIKNNPPIIIGAIFVAFVSYLTMIASAPRIYSPYSFVVIIPAILLAGVVEWLITEPPLFVIYLLGILPITLFYIIWSFCFIKKPYCIQIKTIILSFLFIVLSVIFNISGYKYGINYQGQIHTIFMYIFNIVGFFLMIFSFQRNRKNPTFRNHLVFNILFFSWLAWVAFPTLGELM